MATKSLQTILCACKQVTQGWAYGQYIRRKLSMIGKCYLAMVAMTE